MKHYFLFSVIALTFLASSCSKDSKIFTQEDAAKLGNSSIEGTVLSRHGEPLSGALVVLRPGGFTTVSGVDGKYSLTQLPAGKYAIEYLLPDYKDTVENDSLVLGLKDLQTVLPMQLRYRYAQIKGTVVDASLNPAAGAGIIVEEQDLESRSVSDGKFSIRKIEPGRIRLFSVVQGVGYGYQEVDVQSDTIYESIQIALDQRGGSIQGTVIDATGKAVNGATVSSFNGELTTTTNANGEYSLTEMPKDGNMQVIVSKGSQQGVGNGINLRGDTAATISAIRINPIADRDLAVIPTTIFGADSHDPTTLLMHPVAADTAIKPLWYYWSFDDGKSWITTHTPNTVITPANLGLASGTHSFKVWCMTPDSITSDTATSYLVVASGEANTDQSINVDSLLALDSLSIWHSGMSAGINVFGAQNEMQVIRINTMNTETFHSMTFNEGGTIGNVIRNDSLTAFSGTNAAYATTPWSSVCGSTWGFINNVFYLSQPESPLTVPKVATDTGYTAETRAAAQTAVNVSSFKGISITYTANAPIAIRMFQKNGTWNGYGWFNLDSSKTPRTVQLPFSSVVQGYSDGSTFAFDPAQLQDIQILQRQEDVCGYSDTTTMEILNLALIKNIMETSNSDSDTSTWSGNMNGNIWNAAQNVSPGTPLINTQTGGAIDINYQDVTNTTISPSTIQAFGQSVANQGLYSDSVIYLNAPTQVPFTLFYLDAAYGAFNASIHSGMCITYQTPNANWTLHVQTKTASDSSNWNNYRISLPRTSTGWKTLSFKWAALAQAPASTGALFTFDPSDLLDLQLMATDIGTYPSVNFIQVKQIGFNRSCD